MPNIFTERMIPHIDGNFAAFLIGMRINKPRKVHKWLPVFSAMPRMIRALQSKPELGSLGHIFGFNVIVQSRRSFAPSMEENAC